MNPQSFLKHDPRYIGQRVRSHGGAFRRAAVTGVWLFVASQAVPCGAAVHVNVARVGFPAIPRGDVVRNGAWTPVLVDLELVDEPAFDGSLRVAQLDNDGDECFDIVEVHLRKDSGESRRVFLYALTNAVRGENRFQVELLNEDGAAVQLVSQGELAFRAQPAQQPEVIADDDILILSVSNQAVGQVRELNEANEVGDVEAFQRILHIGHMSPSELPEHWIGLEIVDYIIWDDANPDDLTIGQVGALLEWVRQGGTLLIAASRTAGALVLNDSLNAVLPAVIGDVQSVPNLPEMRRELVPAPFRPPYREEEKTLWYDIPFPEPVPTVQCSARPGADHLAYEPEVFSDVLTRWRVGRGAVLFCGVTMADLFSAPGSAKGFYKNLFRLAPLETGDQGAPLPLSLFDRVAGAVSFATSGSLYLLIATFASIAYVVASTFGSWSLLSARGWRRHSWTAFAATAVAASILTVVAVNFMRGFGESLRQLSIIDVEAGQGVGQATVLLGLRATLDKQLDVWLPEDPLGAIEPESTVNFLRPLPGANDPVNMPSSFADPEDYRVVPASAMVEGVRLRATLKQFEGRWRGPLGGKVTGAISVFRGRFTPESYVINNLPVTLRDCIVVQPAMGFVPPFRPRGDNIYAFNIGDIAPGERALLAERSYRLSPGESFGRFMVRSRLSDAQKEWQRVFSRIDLTAPATNRYAVGDERRALLLVSTVGDLGMNTLDNLYDHFMGRRTVSRDRMRTLDLRDALESGRPGTADSPARPGSLVLIGFADDPGPARLYIRERDDRPFRRVQPDPRHSSSMYRIRLPFTDLGGGADPSADELVDPEVN